MPASDSRFRIFTLIGTPVFVDMSALFLLFFIYNQVRYLAPPEMVAVAVIILVSILLHELGHALMARLMRMRGMEITFMAMGGMCSTGEGEHTPAKSFAISSAGVLVNFALAGTAWALWHYRVAADVAMAVPMGRLCYFVIVVNLIQGIFNSLPLFPLDGGQATLAGLTWVTGREAVARKITLYLAFAVGAAALGYFYLNGANWWNMGLIAVLLFISYQTLTRR